MANLNDRWYFTKERLENSPSRKHGFDSHKELSNRQQAANFIQDMGQRLKVSQLCINTAIVYMHRFYVFHSFTHFPWNQMAAAALFLAAKVEEQPRKLEYVIRVANICKNGRDTNIDVNSERYISQSQDLVFNENVLLQTLGFDVAIDHPHTHVVRCCHLVRASKDLAQTSYFMASNSLHLTTMCIQYKPTVVACFCILVACKWSNWEIPLSYEKKEWYSYVDSTVTAELLQQLTEEFLVIFEKCPSRLKEKIMAIAENVNHIPTHHTVSPFDDPKKIKQQQEEAKDGHSHRSSGLDNDPHKHRSSRPHDNTQQHGSSAQHQRDRDRERERRERQQQHQKVAMGSSGVSNNSANMKSSHSSSSSSHHRSMDPKMKPLPSSSSSRPHSMPYPQPKDILREAASRDSPFGLAREYSKDPHHNRSENKDSSKRDYQYKNNNQQEGNNAYSDIRMNYPSDINNKPTLDTTGRPRMDPNKIATSTSSRGRQEESSKSHLENIKKHLTAASSSDKYLPKVVNEPPKSVHKTVTPMIAANNVKLSQANNSGTYAPPPLYQDIKTKTIDTIKEEVPTPPIIKRPSLFSPEKTPPHKQTIAIAANENNSNDCFASSGESKRERNYSSSSEPELRPVMKKIDQVEGFENLIRDNTIDFDGNKQTPDHITKLKMDDISPMSDVEDFKTTESNGDSGAIINSNRGASVNGLETDPTVISNLLKEASATASHLATNVVVPSELPNEIQNDKNHYHHKSKKKNKDKHKHKDKNREEKEKKKKHKDKDREKHRHSKDKTSEGHHVPAMEPLKLKIQRDKIIMEPVAVAPPPPIQGLKIKIPKNKINTENITELSHNAASSHPPPVMGGIKLKIPKDKLSNCPNLESSVSRKRERDSKDRGSPDNPPSKVTKSSHKEAKTNGKYSSNNNKVSYEVVNSRNEQTQSNFVTNQHQHQKTTNNYKKIFSAPPPPPPPPVQTHAHSQMYYYDQIPPPIMPNLNVPPPPYMYLYNQPYLYAHPPPVIHNHSSNPPLPMDAPPQAPPPPPE